MGSSDVLIWTPRNCPSVCADIRILEHPWCDNPIALPMFRSMVREYVWPCTSKLLDARIACRTCTRGQVSWIRHVHQQLHSIATSVWSLPVSAFWKCSSRGSFYELLLPQAPACGNRIRNVDVVGNNVLVSSLRRGFGCRCIPRSNRILHFQDAFLA